MTVRRLDPVTGDITTSGQHFLTGRLEIAQTIKTRLYLFQGEYFRDVNEGTPWFQKILGKGGDLPQKESILRRRILQTPGVIRLVSFTTDFDVDSRTYSVRAEVQTRFGAVSVET